jgi:hypothetical protein
MLTIGGVGRRGSGIGWEAQMNGGGRKSSLGGHVGRSVVGDNSSLGASYRPEGEQKRGREGMCLTVMVDLQCVSFRIEGEPRLK